jgi:hypothetical protein
MWKDLILAAVDDWLCIPKVNVTNRRQNTPWISKDLIRLCRKKKAAYMGKQKSRENLGIGIIIEN